VTGYHAQAGRATVHGVELKGEGEGANQNLGCF
jgi:hypothetical protein